MTASPTYFKVEIGFGAGVNSGTPSWSDVTDDVVVPVNGPAVVMTTGRKSVRDGIIPGTCSFSLENLDGDYDPLNASGPYYGDLNIGVPVRIVVRYDTVNYVQRWTGFVASPWAQELRRYDREIPVECHDVFGLMASANRDWPDRYESQILRFTGGDFTGWWRPGATGWIDQVSKDAGRWTAQPTETPSPVPGGGSTWLIPWTTNSDDEALHPEGIGVLPPLWKANPSGDHMLSLVWSSDDEAVWPRTVYQQNHTPGGHWDTCGVVIGETSIDIVLPNADGDLVWLVEGPRIFVTNPDDTDWGGFGRGMHHMLVLIPDEPADSADPSVWIDGIEYGVGTVSTPLTNVTEFLDPPRGTLDLTDESLFGGPDNSLDPDTRGGGYIDHIATWENVTATAGELATFAAGMWSALFNTQQTLDERVIDIAAIAGVSDYVGTLDPSGITTLQSYRPGAPLDRLQEVEDTEQGRIWVDGDGLLRFSRRQWAWEDTESTTTQLIATDDASTLASNPTVAAEPLESGADVRFDPLSITNSASVNSTYGRQQTYRDEDSIAKYGIRNPVTLSGLLHGQDTRSLSIAEWLVKSSSTPALKVRRLGFHVEDNQSVLEEFAAKVQEGWLVDWVLNLPGGQASGQGHVIGHSHEWSLTGWTVYLEIDPTRTGWSFFTWGTSEWDGTEGWAF